LCGLAVKCSEAAVREHMILPDRCPTRSDSTMRVLLSTIGSRGDVQPLVALALELRAHGQDASRSARRT